MKKLLLTLAVLALVFSGTVLHAEEVLFSFERGLEGWEIPDWAYEKPDHVQKDIESSKDYASNGNASLKNGY